MDISRSGHRVVVGTGDTAAGVLIYDGFTGEQVGTIAGVNGGYITPADQLFVTSFGGELTQYDLDSLDPIRSFGGSRGYIQGVVGTGDGSVIAVRGGDRSVTLYDVPPAYDSAPHLTIADDAYNFIALSTTGTGWRSPALTGCRSGTLNRSTGSMLPAGSPVAT